MLGQVLGARVAHRHRAVTLQQQERGGLAHRDRTSYDDALTALDRNFVELKQFDDAARGAGDEAGPCADACCAGSETNANQAVTEPTSDSTNAGHLETGVAGKEYIILSVSGMTCTGCETELSRTLSTLPSLTKVKVSLVLSRVKFDLDSTVQSVA